MKFDVDSKNWFQSPKSHPWEVTPCDKVLGLGKPKFFGPVEKEIQLN